MPTTSERYKEVWDALDEIENALDGYKVIATLVGSIDQDTIRHIDDLTDRERMVKAQYEIARKRWALAADQLYLERNEWVDGVIAQNTAQWERMIDQNDTIISLLDRIAGDHG